MMKNINKEIRICWFGDRWRYVARSGAASPVMSQDSYPNPPNNPLPRLARDSTGRDPFKKYEPPEGRCQNEPGNLGFPSIQERINLYKAQKQAAMNARDASAEADDGFVVE